MEGMVTRISPLVMDTKGSCFWCLKILNVSDIISSKVNRSIVPFRLLSGYVNVDVKGVLKSSSASLVYDQSVLENGQVAVPLCPQCTKVAGEFTELHRQFEAITAKVNDSVRRIFGVMDASARNVEAVRQYHKRTSIKTPTAGDLITINMTNNLRKEMLEKCSIWARQVFPEGSNSQQSNVVIPEEPQTSYLSTEDSLDSGNGAGGIFPDDVTEEDGGDGDQDEEFEMEENSNSCTSEEAIEIDPNITIITKERITADQITFSAVPGGRHQCSLCSKRVTANSRRFHVLQHTGQSPYRCDHCEKTFRHPANVSQHTYLHHRDIYFAEHKHPSISSKHFIELVTELFNSLNVSKQGDSCYHCTLCDSCRLTIKSDVHSHMIRIHMEQLVPRLLKLQKRVLDHLCVFTGSSSPRKRGRPSGLTSSKRQQTTTTTAAVAAADPIQDDNPSSIRLSHGKRKGQLGSRGVGVDSEPIHDASSHPLGAQAKSCPHCSASFGFDSNLRTHVVAKHSWTFFAYFKDPRLSVDQFDTIITQMFQNLELDKVGDLYKCCYCSEKECAQWRDMRAHLAYSHANELRPVVKPYQDNVLAQMGLSPSSGGGGGRGGGRAEAEVETSEIFPAHKPNYHHHPYVEAKQEIIKIEDSDGEEESDMVLGI